MVQIAIIIKLMMISSRPVSSRLPMASASDAVMNMQTIGADYELGIRAYKAYGNNATPNKIRVVSRL